MSDTAEAEAQWRKNLAGEDKRHDQLFAKKWKLVESTMFNLNKTTANAAHGVEFTRGCWRSIKAMIAELFVLQELGVEKRNALEARIKELEARPTTEHEALRSLISALSDRLAEVEKRETNLRYCGVFEIGRTYQEGNFVTFDGSIWHCKAATQTRPGQSDRWVLACKRGSDAKDARR
jgi:hypothetical protein